MPHSGSPESHDNTPNHGNDSESGGAVADTLSGESGHPSAPSEHNGADNSLEQTPWWRDKAFVIQLLIFFVGCYVAWIYSGQLDQMRESNKISREALQSVQRAFISFSGISGGIAMISPDGKTRVAQELYLNWYNNGTTPARHAIALGNFQSWRGDLPQGYDFHDIVPLDKNIQASQIVFGPHETVPLKIVVATDNFRAQRAGTDKMFFYGWIVYRDIFDGDPERLTEFCTEMIQVAIVDSGKDISDPSNNFAWHTQPCREHNCYDEDCPDYKAKIKYARESKP